MNELVSQSEVGTILNSLENNGFDVHDPRGVVALMVNSERVKKLKLGKGDLVKFKKQILQNEYVPEK
jgi:hypothetical protein